MVKDTNRKLNVDTETAARKNKRGIFSFFILAAFLIQVIIIEFYADSERKNNYFSTIALNLRQKSGKQCIKINILRKPVIDKLSLHSILSNDCSFFVFKENIMPKKRFYLFTRPLMMLAAKLSKVAGLLCLHAPLCIWRA